MEEWLNYLDKAPPALEADTVGNRKPIFVAGINAIEGIHETCCLGCTRGIFLAKGNKIYNVDLQGGYCGYKEKETQFQCCFGVGEEAVFNQILSTFRFLE